MKKTRRRDDSPFKMSLLDALLARVLGGGQPSSAQRSHSHGGGWRPPEKIAPTKVTPAKKRKRGVELEPLEPRLLMSADLSYAGAGPFTLNASGSVLNLVNNASHATVSSYALAPGAQTVTIQRSSGSDSGGDTLDFNLDTFSAANSQIGAGNTLTLQFTSANQGKDQIVLLGTNANNATPGETLKYNLTVASDLKIASSGAATVQGNLTI